MSHQLFGVQITTDDSAGNGHTCNYVVRAYSVLGAQNAACEAYPDAVKVEVCDLMELVAFQYDGFAQLCAL